jgi:hypothetical protein
MLFDTLVKPRVETNKWLVSENSSLSVNGSTNINKFTCDIPNCDQTDTITVSKPDKDVKLSGSIHLSIKSFDCHNDMMTRNLRKTLKESEFPSLQIEFLTLNSLPDLTIKPCNVTGLVEIKIAGANKQYQVKYQISEDAQHMIHLLGTREVCFSDFNLQPPKKLGGLVRAKDQLTVIFHLKMKAI